MQRIYDPGGMGIAIQILTVLSILLVAENSYAVSCPMAADAYKNLYERLVSFNGLVTKNGGKCDNPGLAESLDGLTKDYLAFKTLKYTLEHDYYVDLDKQIKRDANGEIKEIQEKRIAITEIGTVNQIEKFSNIINSRASTIINAISKSECLDDKEKKSVLSSTASVIQEVTAVAAVFTGPYSVALSVGGAAVTGIMKAIDTAVQKSKMGYDFNQRDDRILFASYLCTYKNIQEEINQLKLPSTQLSRLEKLSQAYDEKIKLIDSKPEAAAFKKQRELNDLVNSQLMKFSDQLNTIKTKDYGADVWAKCSDISTLASSDLSFVDSNTDANSKISFKPIAQREECWSTTHYDKTAVTSRNDFSFSLIDNYINQVLGSMKNKLDEILITGENARLAREQKNKENHISNT
ncbi:MAG: hypothetical protein KA715_06045 [Xanthomonadaceae bacterium]|nr:hypothetical protein [Xanthomonadaceae bacterium]